jgi:hypothetical protein
MACVLPAGRFGDTTRAARLVGQARLVRTDTGGGHRGGTPSDVGTPRSRHGVTTSNVNTYKTAFAGPSLRVVPASRGAWRVEDASSLRELCATRAEAEVLAERLLRELGGGQLLVYDAYQRLRTVKRLPG